MTSTSSPQTSALINTRREVPVTSRVSPTPELVAVMADLNNGVLKIRFFLCPGSTVLGANLVYQAAAPVKVALSNNWAPFPDSYSALYRQAVIYRMYRYLNDPRADKEYLKLQDEIKKAQAGDDAEQTSVSVVPAEPLVDADGWDGGW
jgi:hypothetical protein